MMTIRPYAWIFLCCILLACVTPTPAATLHPERDYQTAWCNRTGGIMEYRLDDGTRVDCMTGDYAVEVDFAPHFYQAIGQSLFYALKTGRQAGILLILESPADSRWIDRLHKVTDAERIRVWTITPEELK